jgi:hypothetical protein
MKGFHVVVKPEAPIPLRFQSNGLASWLGYSHYNDRDRIAAVLEAHKYTHDEVVDALKRMGKACYPREFARVGKFLIEPAPVQTMFTAWRETNIGAEKELDASVFWRAILSLDSCVESLQELRLSNLLDDLQTDATSYELYSGDKLDSLDETIQRYAKFLWLFHPIVVTDAQIWTSSNGELCKIDVARYMRSDGVASVNRWFDLVSREYFDKHIADITGYYRAQFRKARGKAV